MLRKDARGKKHVPAIVKLFSGHPTKKSIEAKLWVLTRRMFHILYLLLIGSIVSEI